MECSKCFRDLYECPDCEGQTNSSIGGWSLTCTTCGSSGWLCSEHGRHWA